MSAFFLILSVVVPLSTSAKMKLDVCWSRFSRNAPADRGSITQEQMVLSQAHELYVRFLGAGDAGAPTIAPQPLPVTSASTSWERIAVAEHSSAVVPTEEEPRVQTAQPAEPVMGPSIGNRI